MRKLILIVFFVLANTVLFYCTPESLNDTNTLDNIEQRCCLDGGSIPPPSDKKSIGG